MKQSICLAIALLGLVTLPAPAGAQKVSYDFDRRFNFAQLRSFTIKEGDPSNNPLVDRRIMAAVANALSARGLRQVDHGADIVVTPTRTTEMRKETTAYNTGFAPYYGAWYGGPWYWGYGPWYWDWGTTVVEQRDVQYDTVTIDMVDANSDALIWRGKGVRHIHSNWKPDDIDEKVQKIVEKIMDHFPPDLSDD